MEGQRNDPNAVPEDEKKIVKRTIKDSVFTDLFQDKKYLLQLYKALHPEDRDAMEDEIEDVTIKHVLVDADYNDYSDSWIIPILTQADWETQ